MSLSEGVIKAANAVSASLDAAVFIYSGTIDYEGYRCLLRAVQPPDDQPERRNAILFLTTEGGSADDAYRIARLLQTIPNEFYLCVPSFCMSAGTLIALGATEIYMPRGSELGPLDAQLGCRNEIDQWQSGLVVSTALEALREETCNIFEYTVLEISRKHNISFEVASRAASMIATGVMAPIYKQVNPESLGNDLRYLHIAEAYGERLADIGGNATKGKVRQLVKDYPSHGFIIDREEAKKLFTKVNETTDEMDTLIRALDEIVNEEQDPRFCHRADRHPIRDETSNHDDKANTEADTAGAGAGKKDTANVDKGREAARSRNRQGQRKAKAEDSAWSGKRGVER